ncbi:MAG TPA: glucoamylase family protein [Steroidobacteraceae bacterium]|nr:glucoamylase family protein [Steroidobacteraceae bacterium]
MHPILRGFFSRFSVGAHWNNEQILREEIFSIERLEQHAESLAAAQTITRQPGFRRSLGARLRGNEKALLAAYRSIARAVDEGRSITPAAEWVLDNYHVVEEQIREIREDLPGGFYRQLPKLAEGPFAGFPRVFGIAWAFVAHTDSRFDPEFLRRFVQAYQRVAPLTIGELWAVAITLRVVLVENLRRVAQRIVISRDARQQADVVADRLLGVNGQAANPNALNDWKRRHGRLTPAFAVQLVQRLRDQDPKVTPALLWLENEMRAQGLDAYRLVSEEHHRQGASNVTVRNIITSMRLMSDVDWADFFESVSLVDATLNASTGFSAMDFATRNLYRSAIEELGRGSPRSELDIARQVLALAAAAAKPREQDPGYFLIAEGRPKLEKAIAYRARLRDLPSRISFTVGAADYVAAIAFTSGMLLAVPLALLQATGVYGGMLWLLGILGATPAMEIAVALVNRAVTRGLGASRLPGLALREGVPEELRTLVAMPVLLNSRAAVEEHLHRLEIHYLASPDQQLHFALLSDWVDANAEHMPGDDALLDIAILGVARLNRKYGPAAGGDRFLLLHRRRLWSESEQRWMGWERKRGKLEELNRLLRGDTGTSYVTSTGKSPWVPEGVKYVITLDADTRVPREAPRRLIGKMAHPLNRPRFDAKLGRVVDGYAILQPRVAFSLPVAFEASPFQRVFSGASGVDPYAAAVSDVYQDLLGEGSFAGKGIYDIDAFEAALAGRVPESSLLSHDLFEGIFARAGLASDVEVVEEFPARYDVASMRQHRWVRGDWQLLPWIFGRADAGSAKHGRGHSRTPLIGVWKMLDNLRRSLIAPSSLAALIAGWTLPFSAAVTWTVFVILAFGIPTLLPVFAGLLPRRSTVTLRSHLRALRNDVVLALGQISLLTSMLAYQAWLMCDAIGRTLWRVFVTRRNMLEWIPADLLGNMRNSFPSFYARMFRGVLLTIGVAVLLIVLEDGRLPGIAVPFLAAWLAAPAIAWRISQTPQAAAKSALSADQQRELRLVARRTWRFFEDFVTAEDHHLPPDNFQEDPRPTVAHRTSPTNIGLYLLSIVAARDFGWCGLRDALDRIEATLGTLARMTRFRGHLYNWYDTRDLRPLEPRYVSSVDSGNLAAHLITLAGAFRQWQQDPQPRPEAVAGLADALDLAREALREFRFTPGLTISRELVETAFADLEAALRPPGTTLDPQLDDLAQAAERASTLVDLVRTLAHETQVERQSDLVYWVEAARRTIDSWRSDLLARDPAGFIVEHLESLANMALQFADAMEFGFLLDGQRKLLSIGFRATDGTLDPSCYDLLASEARLASFVAIAKGDVPARHWFRLGRTVTPIGAGAALVSWSGSMFEYLMPDLVLRAPGGSILAQTSRLVVKRQIEYGEELHIPWGVSESAYNARDLELTYQYSNFGVPGLGLKRGLSENKVVAPYATGLAAMVDGEAALANYRALAAIGARGRFGYYEAVDFTPSRLPAGETHVLVRAYMAHHQGMSIVSIANALLDTRMRDRFHSDVAVQATELLLQERTPRDVSVAHPRAEEVGTASRLAEPQVPQVRRLRSPHDSAPQTHLLCNGRYAVMITAAGSGYSRWNDLAITRWREDPTRDDTGSYFLLREVENGRVWSAGYQPCAVQPTSYEVSFTEDRAEIIRADGDIVTTLEVQVSFEEDAEVRRLSISNAASRPREIEVTSYAELVLGPQAADVSHPAFSKMFVRTEFVERHAVLLANRRRRAPDEPEVWVSHHAVVEGAAAGAPQFETDRARFIGRGRELRAPLAMLEGHTLSGSVGTVLDPVFALRYRVRVPAGGTVRVAFWTCVAASREQVLELADKHRDTVAHTRAATLAWTQAQVQLRHLGIDASQANLFQQLAGHILFADAAARSPGDAIRRGAGGPQALWSLGVSGDLPIVLLRIEENEDLQVARQLLQAHEYWGIKRLAVDLVFLNDRGASYLQDLHVALESMVRIAQARPRIAGADTRGKVFVLRSDLVTAETRAQLLAVSRVVLAGRSGSLADQVERMQPASVAAPRPARRAAGTTPFPTDVEGARDLEFFNGLGGFAAEGREYVVAGAGGATTPAPWINVIANRHFGFQVSTDGGGYTWARNSRENALTPWSNDPVTDRPGEAIYLRDEETGELWTPTPAPIRHEQAQYSCAHGFGYSRFQQRSHGLDLELTLLVAQDAPVKLARLVIRNDSPRRRTLSVTAYVEWVMGPSRGPSAAHIITDRDAETGALLARNPWNAAFAGVAFLDLGGRQGEWTCDRREFLGRHGTLDAPLALVAGTQLGGKSGAALDPCGALRSRFELDPGASTTLLVLLGEADSDISARDLVRHHRGTDFDALLEKTRESWSEVTGAVQVSTPDRALDLMLNGWLLYQALSCRTWARAAFYQASGAYGFRDQLQDAMALGITHPQLLREQILRAAGRQFPEGDVQHWWLPHSGQGVRTHISDDRVWLAYATAHYVQLTGDREVLDTQIPFIEGPPLPREKHDAFFEPLPSRESATLFEHCRRGLEGASLGPHGLPLIGTGDWNDGMNRVGEHGRGESVWLGWFLHATLMAFAPLARERGDLALAGAWLGHAARLRAALEQHAWDGDWYRRGFYDDGTPLGSASNDECRIDAIAQSWSVISGAGNPARAARAMEALEAHLLKRDPPLALLFTPPFEKSLQEPGYVKAYPRGVRENGGQYSHAAAWTVIALALQGKAERALEVFSMLNPVRRASSRAEVQRYKVEPYVVAADVYGEAPHEGRGGWTWYTGSAGWMYRAGLEWILGFRLREDQLTIAPCVPADWPGFSIRYLHGRSGPRRTPYLITVERKPQADATAQISIDGRVQKPGRNVVDLVDDGATHSVHVSWRSALAAGNLAATQAP